MPTAPMRSPATRSSSRPASTTSSTTSCTWCSRACRMRRAARKGISLFIVPKFNLARRRKARSAQRRRSAPRIEEKMGIHGNSTCVLNFDGATGYLVGAENEGMRCMFTMMNAARLGVGMQGVGVAEAAYQASLAYARERLQMRAVDGRAEPERPRRSDHRASRRAADVADAEGADRRRRARSRTTPRSRPTSPSSAPPEIATTPRRC